MFIVILCNIYIYMYHVFNCHVVMSHVWPVSVGHIARCILLCPVWASRRLRFDAKVLG